MEIRLTAAAALIALFAGLFVLYTISRRAPSVLLFGLSAGVGLAGGVTLLLFDLPLNSPVLRMVAMASVLGGAFGSVLTGVDCVREERWRREPERPSIRPDDGNVQELIRRGRSGQPAVGVCPRCSRRVCFRADLSCPGCGGRLEQA